MRVRWVFFYETKELRFQRVHVFRGSITAQNAKVFGLPPEGGQYLLRVVPDAETRFPHAAQTGKLQLELPGRAEETEAFARWFIVRIAEHLAFKYGPLKAHGSLITGEHLPETEQEAEELGEERFFARAHLVEVVDPPPTFDGATMTSISTNPQTCRYMRQFNRAIEASNPADRFLGLVRILEDHASSSKHGSLVAALENCRELYDIAYERVPIWTGGFPRKPTREEVNELYGDFARVRDHCAHLRTEQGLGIAHGDPQIGTQVEPLVEPLQRLCAGLIERLLARDEQKARADRLGDKNPAGAAP